MPNNKKFTNVEKQIFFGDYPLVSEPLAVKTAVKAGDVIGVDASGNYGKYDKSVTYTTPYAIAYEEAEANKQCSALLTAYLVESFVLLPSDPTEKLKLKQELRKIGLFLR
jgi:hypothetical protein